MVVEEVEKRSSREELQRQWRNKGGSVEHAAEATPKSSARRVGVRMHCEHSPGVCSTRAPFVTAAHPPPNSLG